MAEFKRFRLEVKQDGESGEVSAVFARFNVMDSDGDITRPGAFGVQKVRMSYWGHDWGKPAIGRGEIREVSAEAIYEGRFFLAMPSAVETYESVKGLEELQEWSYGYDVSEYSLRQPEESEVPVRWDGMIRELVKLQVHEVSPVLLGAGVGTGTLSLKGQGWVKGSVLGSQIVRLRDTADLTNVELSAVSELSTSALGNILRGDTKCPSVDSLTKLASALDTSVDRLIAWAEADGCAIYDAPTAKEEPKADPDHEVDPVGQKLFLEFQRTRAQFMGAVEE